MEPALAVKVTFPPPGGNVGHCPLTVGRWVGPAPPPLTTPELLVEPLELELVLDTPELVDPLPEPVPFEPVPLEAGELELLPLEPPGAPWLMP
jgi:hypothetical protein